MVWFDFCNYYFCFSVSLSCLNPNFVRAWLQGTVIPAGFLKIRFFLLDFICFFVVLIPSYCLQLIIQLSINFSFTPTSFTAFPPPLPLSLSLYLFLFLSVFLSLPFFLFFSSFLSLFPSFSLPVFLLPFIYLSLIAPFHHSLHILPPNFCLHICPQFPVYISRKALRLFSWFVVDVVFVVVVGLLCSF